MDEILVTDCCPRYGIALPTAERLEIEIISIDTVNPEAFDEDGNMIDGSFTAQSPNL